MKDAECKIQVSGLRIEDKGEKMEYGIQKMKDAGFRTQVEG